jgi:benzoyl-CoA reductase/2-hydroxyglutaryl-CoA dehydratase subunit BcrC/BadD/HgdB
MCPHVKRLLDRAIAGDLPGLDGVVFMNSCEAMRRLYDAWRLVRPDDRVILADLPVTRGAGAIEFFATELERLAGWLFGLSGTGGSDAAIEGGIAVNNKIASAVEALAKDAREGRIGLTRGRLQGVLNNAVTNPPDKIIEHIDHVRAVASQTPLTRGAPVYMFGNVLPIEEVFDLIEGAGMRVVDDDICTGLKQLRAIPAGDEKPIDRVAKALLHRPPCARTVDPDAPDMLARSVAESAAACGAKGVIAHVMKFCDPYLARLPEVRAKLKKAGIPFLLLEGDCTLRSIGQQRTRIEAFSEMVGGEHR